MNFLSRLKVACVCGLGGVLTGAAYAQSVSQDYARYSNMLNQERAETARREQQSMYDQAARSNRAPGSNQSGSSNGSYSSSGGSSTASDVVGLLGNTLNNFAARQNARQLQRQQAERDYAERRRREQAEDARVNEVIFGKEKKKSLLEQNLEKAARGDPEGIADAGRQYLYGIGVPVDQKRGVAMIEDAARHGHVPSMVNLAYWYRDPAGLIVPTNIARSNEWLTKAAEAGDVKSMAVLGEFLSSDFGGVKPDLPQALAWSERAAAKGDAVAAENAGIYLSGYATLPPDRVKAVAYFRQAIAAGSKTASDSLLRLYEGGDGTEPDYAMAFKLHVEFAEKGDPVHMMKVGVYYARGYGMPRDDAKAISWLERAAKAGSARALYEMASIYDQGENNVRADKDKALALYRQSAVEGFPKGLYVMGFRIFEGKGVQQDEIEGDRLIRLAAEKGDDQAPGIIAQMYQYGLGVDENHDEEAKWLRLAVRRGDKKAEERLGALGVPLEGPIALEGAPAMAASDVVKAPAAGKATKTVLISTSVVTATIGTVESYDTAAAKLHARIANLPRRTHGYLDYTRLEIEAMLAQARKTRPDLSARDFVLEIHERAVAGDVEAGYYYAAARVTDIGFKGIADKECEGYIGAAMKAGKPEAIRDYAILCLTGKGLDEDLERGFKLLNTAAEKKLISATALIGDLLYDGIGVEQDQDAAGARWKEAADAGLSPASYLYGLWLTLRKRPEEAVVYFKRAAEAGEDRAMLQYGITLDQGQGIKADANAATEWFDKAAEAGNPKAQYLMGKRYAEGEVVNEDVELACAYWEASAKNGNSSAQLNIGVRQLSGDGTPVNRESAIEWLKKSAKGGNEAAAEELKKLGVDA